MNRARWAAVVALMGALAAGRLFPDVRRHPLTIDLRSIEPPFTLELRRLDRKGSYFRLDQASGLPEWELSVPAGHYRLSGRSACGPRWNDIEVVGGAEFELHGPTERKVRFRCP